MFFVAIFLFGSRQVCCLVFSSKVPVAGPVCCHSGETGRRAISFLSPGFKSVKLLSFVVSPGLLSDVGCLCA